MEAIVNGLLFITIFGGGEFLAVLAVFSVIDVHGRIIHRHH